MQSGLTRVTKQAEAQVNLHIVVRVSVVADMFSSVFDALPNVNKASVFVRAGRTGTTRCDGRVVRWV